MVDETRDIAVEARTMIQHHMTDCVSFRTALREDLEGFRDDIKRIQIRMAYYISGIIVVLKILEFGVSIWHAK